MASMYQKFSDWYGPYTPQEQEYINELNRIEKIQNPKEFENEVAEISLSNLLAIKNFLKIRGLETIYPNFLHEINAQMILQSGQEDELLAEQVESLYDMIKRRDFSVLIEMPLKEKKRYINYIQKFRKEHDNEHAYEELYKLLEVKKQAPLGPVEGYYPVTMQTLLKTAEHQAVPMLIMNLNAVELRGPKCQVTKNVHIGIEDYPDIVELYGDLPDNIEELPKEITFETLCNPLIAQRQVQNECGLMSIYNALQFYDLLNKKIDKPTFEQNLKSFNIDDWINEVESCPIDTDDIIRIMARRAPGITKNRYTIIPTIVDDNGQLGYYPLKNKSVATLPSGDIEASFDQDSSLLHAIQNIHNENVPTYTHIFFLNNLQLGAQGASMRHWIPVVLHKEDNQLYLYTINSQSVFREDLIDPFDKVVDLETLARIVAKDNGWLQALAELLRINPEALSRGLEIVSAMHSDDYNHDYIPDILEALMDDNSELADEIRGMLIR